MPVFRPAAREWERAAAARRPRRDIVFSESRIRVNVKTFAQAHETRRRSRRPPPVVDPLRPSRRACRLGKSKMCGLRSQAIDFKRNAQGKCLEKLGISLENPCFSLERLGIS
jgi:hypothetical protein